MNIFPRQIATNDPFCGFALGDKVCDSITGFTGVVTGRIEYLSGCNQILVQPKSDAENEIKRSEWFDVERIILVEAQMVEISTRQAGFDKAPPDRSPTALSGASRGDAPAGQHARQHGGR
jgi:hypothetical protein